MEGFVLFIHIVVCLLLVIVVLLQSGKSADLAGAFGGMGSQSTFGPRGSATFMSKMTTTLAILFMVTSLTLWLMASKNVDSGSVLTPDDVKQEQTTGTNDSGGTENKATEGKTPQTGDETQKSEAADTTNKKSGTSDTGTSTDPAKENSDNTGSDSGKQESGNTGDSKEGSQG